MSAHYHRAARTSSQHDEFYHARRDTHAIEIGWTQGYSSDIPVFLHPVDRRQHLALLGRSGMGKSTLLKHIFAHDVTAGAGVGIIDPHGDLARECLETIPRPRINEVIYFNPTDLDHPIGFNLLEDVPADARPALVSRLVNMFRHLFGDSWGPRVERLLLNGLAVLLDQGDATLVGLVRLLNDPVWRKKAVARTTDPIVAMYWQDEFPRLDDRLGGELDQPLQNKLSFLASPALRNIIGQTKSALRPRLLMDGGHIMIADLSKGILGDTHAQILGSLLVAGFEQAAMTRADTPEHARRPFYLLIDEFQNFVTDSFPVILAECRKYRLALTVANQYLEQLTEATRAALLGNVGSLVTFRIGANDAHILARDMAPLDPVELLSLSVGDAWCRLLDHGMADSPTLVHMHRAYQQNPLRNPEHTEQHVVKIIEQSRTRFASSRIKVESHINAFLRLKDMSRR